MNYSENFSFLISNSNHMMLIIDDKIHDKRIEYHANSIDLFKYIIKYHANEQLITITRKHVWRRAGSLVVKR